LTSTGTTGAELGAMQGGRIMRRDGVMRQSGADLTLLLDYYGELLPPKQRSYCDLRFNQDLSLAEIALETGISRQGVHDSLLHAEAALREFERVLGCAARDARIRETVARAEEELHALLVSADEAVRKQAQGVLHTLQTIRE